MAMLAQSVRIGDQMLFGKKDAPSEIKRLNETCALDSNPHVHIVHEAGALCVGFRRMINARRSTNNR